MSEQELPVRFLVVDLSDCEIWFIERSGKDCWNKHAWTSDGWQYDDEIGNESAMMLYQSEQVFIGAE